MKKVLIATTICTAMLASCGQNSAEYKKLKAENDSLRIENTKSNAEMDEILGTLNDVEADIQSIRDAENYLNIQQQKGDLNKSSREQIKENMQLISETLKKNKQQISELEEKLKKSGIQSSALRKTISRLSSELDCSPIRKVAGTGQETSYCLLLLRYGKRAERPEDPFRRWLIC